MSVLSPSKKPSSPSPSSPTNSSRVASVGAAASALSSSSLSSPSPSRIPAPRPSPVSSPPSNNANNSSAVSPRSSTSSTATTASSSSSSSSLSNESSDSFDVDFRTLSDVDRIAALANNSNTNVAVCVRLRPMNAMERNTKQFNAWTVKDNIVFQTAADGGQGKPKPQSFMYDHIFTEDKNNEHIYEHIGSPILQKTMEGYHGCIFAYGQTSSGKTHTIHGTGEDPGMIPLAVEGIFDFIEATTDRVFTLRVSYLEIYNEIINDLLDPLNTNLQIREDKKKGVYCDRLKEDIVISPEQVFSLLAGGESHRHVGKTNYNEISSRSHTIFRLVCESMEKNAGKSAPVRTSVLNLVDLAGSENAVKAGSTSRVKETGFINRSLLTLGHVISKLSERVHQHIPYRDSKLTRILQSSLSGKACVAVVCNLSPSSGNIEETVSTLKFASRAKKVKASAQINEVTDQSALIVQYRDEIDRLKSELEKYKQMPMKTPGEPMAAWEEKGKDGKDKSDTSYSGGRRESISRDRSNSLIDDPVEEAQITQAALNAQIEQLTRMILSSSQEDSEGKPSIGTRQPTLRGKKSTLKSPYVGMSRQNTLSEAKHKEPSTSVEAAAVSTPAPSASLPPSNSASTALIAPVVESLVSPSQSTSPSPPSFSRSNSKLPSKVSVVADYSSWTPEDLIRRCRDLEESNHQLHEAIQQSQREIDSWQQYYVQVNNKNAALESRIKAITSSHQEKLQKALITRTSSVTSQHGNDSPSVSTNGKTQSSEKPSTVQKVTATATLPLSQPVAPVAPVTSSALVDLSEPDGILAEGQKMMDELTDLFTQFDNSNLN